MPRKKKECVEPGCAKWAVGKTDKCVEHGGGRRCIESGCGKSAREKSDKCKAHGGGRRCIESGCGKSAREKSDKCVEHGGGRRCEDIYIPCPGCSKFEKDAEDTLGETRVIAHPRLHLDELKEIFKKHKKNLSTDLCCDLLVWKGK